MFVIIVFYYIDHPCISSAEHFVLKPKLQITIMAVDSPTLQLQRMRALLASRNPTLRHLTGAHFTKTQIDGEKAKKKVDMMKQTSVFYMLLYARWCQEARLKFQRDHAHTIFPTMQSVGLCNDMSGAEDNLIFFKDGKNTADMTCFFPQSMEKGRS